MKTTPALLALLSLLLAPVLAPASGLVPPKPLTTVGPEYPKALMSTGSSGKATIEVVVGEDGLVGSATVASADEPAFGEAALVAARQWTFEPALRDGKPVEVKVKLPFIFNAPVDSVAEAGVSTPSMEQQFNEAMKREVFQTITEPVISGRELGKQIRPRKRVRPMYPSALAGTGVEERVMVEFVIGPDGRTLNPKVLGSPRKEFVVPALVTVARWEFDPVKQDGKAVYVSMRHPVRFAETPPQRRGGGGFGGDGDGDGGGGGGDGD